jgi:hypothetical protein
VISTNGIARAALGVAGLALTIVVAQSAQAAPPPHAPAYGYRNKKGTTAPKSSHVKGHQSRRSPWDIDGDGRPNGRDSDMDGDGIANSRDRDIDGDGIPNNRERNAKGNHPRNSGQTNKPGFMKQMKHKFDGNKDKKHARKGDIDKDGIANRKDKDIDGDGIRNKKDKDRDGDHVANKKDDFDRRKNKK